MALAFAFGAAAFFADFFTGAFAEARFALPAEAFFAGVLADFAPGCRVVVPDEHGAHTRTIEALLPNKYRRPG